MRIVLAILLIGAGVNTCIPWKTLQRSFITIAMDVEDEDQDGDEERDTQDERDADDERTENDERESKGFEKEFFGIHHTLQLVNEPVNVWHAIEMLALYGPVIDLQVPPPKQVC